MTVRFIVMAKRYIIKTKNKNILVKKGDNSLEISRLNVRFQQKTSQHSEENFKFFVNLRFFVNMSENTHTHTHKHTNTCLCNDISIFWPSMCSLRGNSRKWYGCDVTLQKQCLWSKTPFTGITSVMHDQKFLHLENEDNLESLQLK